VEFLIVSGEILKQVQDDGPKNFKYFCLGLYFCFNPEVGRVLLEEVHLVEIDR
jgi:hypothetical protein